MTDIGGGGREAGACPCPHGDPLPSLVESDGAGVLGKVYAFKGESDARGAFGGKDASNNEKGSENGSVLKGLHQSNGNVLGNIFSRQSGGSQGGQGLHSLRISSRGENGGGMWDTSYTTLSHKLRSVWRLKGGYALLDVGFDYFMVKFNLLEDRDKVLLGGLWMIVGHYLVVKSQTQDFRPCKPSFGSTMVWICIAGLPIWCYQGKAMLRIATAIGVPIKVAKLAEREKYARACVHINFGFPVIKKLLVDSYEYEVEYESLDLICGSCSCFGHGTKNRKHQEKVAAPKAVSQDHGVSTKEASKDDLTLSSSVVPNPPNAQIEKDFLIWQKS
ncbi:uncharacterized protein LOC107621483 [Arachis ipaensis]|uniref:uncharacterized protein LOC107621483 n=1 Tax=Arachis ipaensis TaxID=130454 RepID=UPI0007AF056F|nr:uncharacterized protein LOC107621483 [Arachis ipaensis]XP_025685547.1 uncharacterized protein LOC112786374 [Arachis hypogaea]